MRWCLAVTDDLAGRAGHRQVGSSKNCLELREIARRAEEHRSSWMGGPDVLTREGRDERSRARHDGKLTTMNMATDSAPKAQGTACPSVQSHAGRPLVAPHLDHSRIAGGRARGARS